MKKQLLAMAAGVLTLTALIGPANAQPGYGHGGPARPQPGRNRVLPPAPAPRPVPWRPDRIDRPVHPVQPGGRVPIKPVVAKPTGGNGGAFPVPGPGPSHVQPTPPLNLKIVVNGGHRPGRPPLMVVGPPASAPDYVPGAPAGPGGSAPPAQGSAGENGNAAMAPGPQLLAEGQLTAQDGEDAVRTGCYAKVYELQLEQGESYVFDLRSADFDAYLRLEDAAGNALAEDDDSGGDLNARLCLRPDRAGSYRLVVTTYGQRMRGGFTLTVR